jgi:hypothetical protein
MRDPKEGASAMMVTISDDSLLLVPEPIVYLVHTLLLEVGSIDCFGVVIGDPSDLGSLGYRLAFLMNKSYQVQSLLIGHLDVLSYHLRESWSKRVIKEVII